MATIRKAEAAVQQAKSCYEDMIKEAKTLHTAEAHDMELSNEESVLKLEHKALMEEGHSHQVFVEACGTALQACPTKTRGALMYPFLLLTDNVPLAGMMASTPQLTSVGKEPLVAASPSTVSRMPAPPIWNQTVAPFV